ncbi:hypothetical protein [Eisenbergiella sp.]
MKIDMNNEKDQRFVIACIVIFILLVVIGGNIFVRYENHKAIESGAELIDGHTGQKVYDNWPN